MEARRITNLSLEELAQVERTEAELDAFVEKRARQAKDAATVEELWAKTAREHHEKRRTRVAEEWFHYHDRLIKNHEDTLGFLVSYHRRERARFAQILGIAETSNNAPEKGV